MYRIRKMFTFEAAHQLDRAYSQACVNCIHGHSYRVEVFMTSKGLDGNQMVVDFGMLREALGEVMEMWDHALILSGKLAREYAGTPSAARIVTLPCSPTAEVMAKILFDVLTDWVKAREFANGLATEKVRVHETDSGWAEYQK